MKNEEDRNKVREPYTPEGTPNPPQIIDPSYNEEREDKATPAENKQQTTRNDRRPPDEGHDEKKKLAGESETALEDETTV